MIEIEMSNGKYGLLTDRDGILAITVGKTCRIVRLKGSWFFGGGTIDLDETADSDGATATTAIRPIGSQAS